MTVERLENEMPLTEWFEWIALSNIDHREPEG